MVRITNPLAGGSPFTSLESAEKAVRKGKARFSTCGKRLTFIEDDYRCLSAAEQIKMSAHGYDTMPRRYLKLNEIRHIPCTQASNAYTLATKPHTPPAGRSGPVEVLVEDGDFAWQEENVA